MKATIAITLAIILCLSVFMLAGCTKPEEPTDAPVTEAPATDAPQTDAPETDISETGEPAVGPVAGGWTVSTDPASAAIPEDAKAALDAALEGLDGVGYEPLAYLGSQVVAGTNYAFLCRSTVVYPGAEAGLSIVKVYRDLEGNASILDIKDIAISDYTEDSELSYAEEGLAGGWTLASDAESAAMPENVQTAFDTATAGLMGVGYHPLAYLGSQVVAGANYAVLCSATSMTAEPQSALAVITIYADLEGGAQILSVSGFDFR